MGSRLAFAATAAAALFAVSACRQFFTASLAEFAVRDPADLVVDVTAADAAAAVEAVKGDPGLSTVLLAAIRAEFATADADDRAALRSAALDAAAAATGVGRAAANSAGDLVATFSGADLDDPAVRDKGAALATAVLADLTNLTAAAADLAAVLPAGTDTVGIDAFAAGYEPERLLATAAVLAAAQAAAWPAGVGDFAVAWATDGPPNETAKLAHRLGLAAARQTQASGSTGPLTDLLNVMYPQIWEAQ